MNMNALTIKNLTVTYNNKPALWNINAEIPAGVMMAIVGPNGAGKTTLIKTVLDLIKPIAGSVSIFGATFDQKRNHIAYVPQRSTVDWNFPSTVFDIVMMGRYAQMGWFARPKQEDYDATWHALEKVGLTTHAHTHISKLSSGQQQRIFLARALVQDAALYLLDEPFVGVDSVTEEKTITLLKELRSAGKTVIVVHHDLHTVSHYFDWLFFLNIEQIACGPINATFTPEYVSATYGNYRPQAL